MLISVAGTPHVERGGLSPSAVARRLAKMTTLKVLMDEMLSERRALDERDPSLHGSQLFLYKALRRT